MRLAGGKNIVVDSKVAFAGYLEAPEARDEATREARLKAHARHLRTHVDQLAAKAYWERFDPSAGVRRAASCRRTRSSTPRCSRTRRCWSTPSARNVVIATPTTLVALLRTVGYAWRQEALARNAREVLELARELYNRLATMGGHVDAVGTALNSAVNRYNKAVGSLESRVLVSARKLRELRVTDDGAAGAAAGRVGRALGGEGGAGLRRHDRAAVRHPPARPRATCSAVARRRTASNSHGAHRVSRK